jgi:hypothetical protein
MGNDIYAHNPNSEFELDTEYAYLRRSAFNFHSEDYYGGCSGTGETVIYKTSCRKGFRKIKISKFIVVLKI